MDQALNSQKTPHTSPLRASYGMSFVSILMKNDRVIKGFYCSWVMTMSSSGFLLKCVHNVFQLRTNNDAHWRVLSEGIRTFLQHYLLFISNYSTQNLFKMYRNACSVIHVSSDTLVGHIPRRFMQLNRSQNIDWLKLQIRFQCEKLSELFTGATFKLFFSFMVISDVWGSFIPNKNTFTSIALLSGF